MDYLHKKGNVVNVYQLSNSKGLLFEGRAKIVRPVGSVGAERYTVQFLDKDGKPALGEKYERFIDREGQEYSPEEYIRNFNKRIGIDT